MPRVSCIIPAHNEAARIELVLKAVVTNSLISEIIVVDDASSDGTSKIAKRYPNVLVIEMGKNMGKTMAVYTGLQAATGEVILLLDADLTGITPQNVTDLLQPVLSGKAAVAISLRANTPWRPIGLDYISGERAFYRSLIEKDIAQFPQLPRFGLEVFMNKAIISSRASLAVVPWMNVASPLKFRKHGILRGFAGDAAMLINIFRVISPWEALRQVISMLKLRVRN